MKRIVITIAMLLVVVLAACGGEQQKGPDNEVIIHGSGVLVSKEVSTTPFDQVETALAIGLDIRQGDEYGVVLTADDNFIDFLQVVQEGNRLTLDLDPRFAYEIFGVTMRVEITAPAVTHLRLAGSSWAALHGLQYQQPFEAELSGSAALIGELEVDRATFGLYGGSYLQLVGSGHLLTVDSCGHNRADFSGFAAENSTVHASCSSYVTVHVSGQLDVEAAQGARVDYFGQPDSVQGSVHEHASFGAEM